MSDLEHKAANGNHTLRREYAIPLFAVCAVLAIVGLLRFARFDGSAMFFAALGAGLTGIAFAWRGYSANTCFLRAAAWGAVALLLLILTFAVRLSEAAAFWMLDLLANVRLFSEATSYSQATFQAARLAWSLAFLCIGAVAAFMFNVALDLRKYHTFLCIRLLRARVINYLVTLAVAGSVFVLIVVLSVLWGFERDFKSRIRGTLAAVSIDARFPERVQDYQILIDWIKENVEHVTEGAPFIHGFVFLRSHAVTTQAMIRGVDLEREAKIGEFGSYLLHDKKPDFMLPDGSEPEYPGVVIGRELAKVIGLHHDDMVITGVDIELDPPRSRFRQTPRYTLVGEFKTGYHEYDSQFVYVPIEEAQRLVGFDYAEATGISLALTDYRYADQVKKALEAELAPLGYNIKTWAEQRPSLFVALHIERVVTTIIVGASVLLSGLFVCAVMLMAVKEKTRDIGIVKAIGGTVGGIMQVFVINGLAIGLAGAALGGMAGLLFVNRINDIARFLERSFGLRVFPPEIYYLDEIPAYVHVDGVAMILCSAIIVSLLAALVPALIAARMNPVESLRYE